MIKAEYRKMYSDADLIAKMRKALRDESTHLKKENKSFPAVAIDDYLHDAPDESLLRFARILRDDN